MLAGAATSALGAYTFQVLGGRTLGPAAFAPVSILWTVYFVAFTVVLLPLEQSVTRRLALRGNGVADLLGPVSLGAIGLATVGAFLFAVLTLRRFFDGNPVFALQAALLGIGYGGFAVGRGLLAGRRRYTAYGALVGGEAVLRVGAAILLLLWRPTAVMLGWAMVLAPWSVLAARPWRTDEPVVKEPREARADARLMAGLLAAQAASQTVLGTAPIVVGLLGGPAHMVSIVFVTFALFRGPVTVSYNLTARLLPEFTDMVAGGRTRALGRWAAYLGAAGLALGGLGGVVAYRLGPPVVAFLYGAAFRPPAGFTGLAGAGVLAGIAVLFITQILVARGHTGRLAAAWLVALAAAVATVFVAGGEAEIRVAAAFLVAEVVALLATVGAVVLPRAARADA